VHALIVEYAIYHKAEKVCPHTQQAFFFVSALSPDHSGITLAAWTEEPLTQASVQTLNQPFSKWITKPVFPV